MLMLFRTSLAAYVKQNLQIEGTRHLDAPETTIQNLQEPTPLCLDPATNHTHPPDLQCLVQNLQVVGQLHKGHVSR